MAGKRTATTDLNHDNWDREEEPEDRGTFKTATDSEMSNRVIKKARRKITTDTLPTKSVFSGFSGFSTEKPTATSNMSAAFSFLSKIPSTSTSSNAAAPAAKESTTTTKMTPVLSFSSSPADTVLKKDSPVMVTKDAVKGKSSTYYAKIKGLNQSVREWIKKHVDETPICLLTPVFKDYERHLNDIEQAENRTATKSTNSLSGKINGSINDQQATAEKPSSTSAASTFSFDSPISSLTTTANVNKEESTPKLFQTVSFGSTPAAKHNSEANVETKTTPSYSFSTFPTTTTTPLKSKIEATATAKNFSFGTIPKINFGGDAAKPNGFNFLNASLEKDAPKENATASSGFSFSASKDNSKPSGFSFNPGSTPFTFGNIQPPPATAAPDEQDEEDVPPKVEFKQVVEADAIYSIKCKVYVKKDEQFCGPVDGTLFLKPIAQTGKMQLLVRADTNLGNILLNLVLSSNIPVQRRGKNNVMLVCLPTPDVKKATTVLLRPKTAEEADELLETINKYKK